MIICIIDENKERESLEQFLIQSNKDYKFLSNLQDGIDFAQSKGVEYLVLDTDKEPVISVERLNVFVRQSEVPCVVLTNNQMLSAKIRAVAKDNTYLTTALYGAEYPNLKEVISFKKKFKNKNKAYDEEAKNSLDYKKNIFKVLNFFVLAGLTYILAKSTYELVIGAVEIKKGMINTVLYWYALGVFGIICSALKLGNKGKNNYAFLIFSLLAITSVFIKFKFFFPILVGGVIFIADFLLQRKKEKTETISIRQETRYKVDGYAYVISSSNAESFNARLLDLSNSGAMLESREMFIVGEEIKINNDSFSVFAEVKRSFKHNDQYRAGVVFHLVTQEHQSKIQEYIAINKI